MIVNRSTLLAAAPIKNMATGKVKEHGVTSGLGEAGYDIRIKQKIVFKPLGWHPDDHRPSVSRQWFDEAQGCNVGDVKVGRFVIASAIEEFQMPAYLVGVVHDKSSWARRGLSVFNTVIESGWCGFLTLELVYHGDSELVIPAGSGIAQVLFHSTTDAAVYSGRYQHQPDEPVKAIHAE